MPAPFKIEISKKSVIMFFYKNHLYSRILSIDFTSRGFGYAVLESPTNLIDWGVKQAKHNKHLRTLSMNVRLIELYQPEIMVVQNTHVESSRRTQFMHKLIEDIETLGSQNQVKTIRIPWSKVRRFFEASIHNASTKHQIAEAIAHEIPELVPRLPPKRKPWMSEDYRMSIFDAVAFGLTYYHIYEPKSNSDFKNSIFNLIS